MDLRKDIAWLYETLSAPELSETILYVRGEESVVINSATAAQTSFSVRSYETVRMNKTDRDWIMKSDLLDFGSGRFEPKRNDIVVWLNGTISNTYKVVNAPSDKVFTYTDQFQTGLRVHCALIETSLPDQGSIGNTDIIFLTAVLHTFVNNGDGTQSITISHPFGESYIYTAYDPDSNDITGELVMEVSGDFLTVTVSDSYSSVDLYRAGNYVP